MNAEACFSKVPKLLGAISGATTAFISSQCRGSKPSNFAVLLVFLILKTWKKISFSKQADCSLKTSFSGPKSSRDFRETGPWSHYISLPPWLNRPGKALYQALTVISVTCIFKTNKQTKKTFDIEELRVVYNVNQEVLVTRLRGIMLTRAFERR